MNNPVMNVTVSKTFGHLSELCINLPVLYKSFS